jgi:hypothetical protein
LEAQLAQSAIPIETPEPDVDECGNLSPRALGHEGSVRTILARQQQIQRQLNARNVLLPSLEAHATEVIQWFKRLSPKFEPFDVYRKVLGEEVKAMTPTGIEITPAGQVSCWLKSIAATLDWVKLEVKKYRAELGREELDWQAFNAHGMAAVEEGKVIFVTPELNRRVLTEEQETQRQADFRLKEIEEETKATVAAEKLEANGGITSELRHTSLSCILRMSMNTPILPPARAPPRARASPLVCVASLSGSFGSSCVQSPRVTSSRRTVPRQRRRSWRLASPSRLRWRKNSTPWA